MESLAELEKMTYPIIDRNSEFHKLDRIDGLLFISMIQEGKSWSEVSFLVGYMKREYKLKGVSIEFEKLMGELRFCEYHVNQRLDSKAEIAFEKKNQ
jgi:hypothetical protein